MKKAEKHGYFCQFFPDVLRFMYARHLRLMWNQAFHSKPHSNDPIRAWQGGAFRVSDVRKITEPCADSALCDWQRF
jgi:hypothetical protein